jgi:copper chaperone CopZ
MITRLRVHGMTCQRCVQAVFTALTPVEGITRADVRIGAATIEHDGRATFDALRSAIAMSGYDATYVAEERRQLPIL